MEELRPRARKVSTAPGDVAARGLSCSRCTRRECPGSFGGILLVERHLGGGVALRVEGGPVSQLFPSAELQRGEEVGSTLVTPLTWWANGGLAWHW